MSEGQFADARDEVDNAALVADRAREPLLSTAAVIAAARIEHSRGNDEQAWLELETARQALATFPDPGRLSALHMWTAAEIVETRPGGTGEAPSLLVVPLTKRELQVLRLLRSSLSLPEIARELYVSPNTVKTHTQRIYRKLHATRRDEAVDNASRLGLL